METNTLKRTRIKRIEVVENSDVYDVSMQNNHNFFANGLLIHNCSEMVLDESGLCLAEGTKIATSKGLEDIESLLERQNAGEQVNVATQTNGKSHNLIYRPATVIKTGEKEVIELVLRNNQTLKLTPEHQVYARKYILGSKRSKVKGFDWIEAGKLTPEYEVMVQFGLPEMVFSSSEQEVNQYRMFGWMSGDGWLTDKIAYGLTFGPKDEFAYPIITKAWRDFLGFEGGKQTQPNQVRIVSSGGKKGKQKFLDYGFKEAKAIKKTIPNCVWGASRDLQFAYLQGLFSADGHAPSARSHQIMLASSSRVMLHEVQQLLINLGIQSSIYWYYLPKRDRYQGSLTISRESSDLFRAYGGFYLTPYKDEVRKEQSCVTKQKRAFRVRGINITGEVVPVYDINEPVTNSLIANGMVVHNCNLGSMNLTRYVLEPYTDNAHFDYAEFGKDVATSVELLDNALTIEIQKGVHVNDRQSRSIENLRRIGLGVMGFADALTMMGLKYSATDEVRIFIDKLFSLLRDRAYMKSIDLAKKKGACGVWKGLTPNQRRKVLKGGFFRTLPERIKNDIVENGTRNVTLTSIAPTGSISNLLGVSSSVEPLFATSYKRMVRMNGEDEFIDYKPSIVQEALENGVGLDFWNTAYDISPQDHVQIIAWIQKYICSSISKTVNFPSTSTPEHVWEIYQKAWKLGLKGVTVYVDKSRTTQVLYADSLPSDKPEQVFSDDWALAQMRDTEACPSCGGELVHQSGCKECSACEYSVCSL